MVRKIRNILAGALLFILLALVVKFLSFSTSNVNEGGTFNQTYKVFPVPLPDSMDFAGEPVPMNHFGVKEELEREMLVNIYWQSQTMLDLKKANRYFPVIEKILKKNGIPDDFKYLALAESGFAYKTSPAGAAGFWQIVKPTALANGLEVGKDIDERDNLKKSTEAACKYFKEAYQHFHNWTLAAASYNMGMAGIAKAMQFQKQDNYYDLGLNAETTRYIYRILALKEIQSHPQNFGFFIKHSDLYPPLPIVEVNVDSSITNLADYAISMHINYRILKILNPWLLSSSLSNPENKTYTISLPETGVPLVDLGEDIVYNDSSKSVSGSAVDTAVQTHNLDTSKIKVHHVEPHETIESIAKKYNVSIEQLRSWNSLIDSSSLRTGDEIIIFKDTK